MLHARSFAAAVVVVGALSCLDVSASAQSNNELSVTAAYGDAELVKELIESGAPVNGVDEQGLTPLAHAVAESNLDTATALLEAGARPFTEALEDSPIVISAAVGNASILEALLRHHIPPSHINEAFNLAASRGDDSFIDTLSKQLGIDSARLSTLRARLEGQLNKPLLQDGRIDSFFVLAALKHCRDEHINANQICLLAFPPGSAPNQATKKPVNAGFSAYRIKRDVSQGILNMRTGPGQRHSLVIPIPAGANVMIGPCRRPDDGISRYDWCEVSWNNHSGWVSSGGIVRAR